MEKQSKEEAYKLACAIMEYGLYGEFDDSDPVISAIMETIGVTIDKAKMRYDKAVENGSAGGRKVKYDKNLIIEMHENGLKNRQIAARLGCSEKTVQRALNDVNIPKVKNDAETGPMEEESLDYSQYARVDENGAVSFDF